jgi:DNA-binding XRE family transcriptional regulator
MTATKRKLRVRRRRPTPARPGAFTIGKKLSKGSLLLRAWRKEKGLTQWQATFHLGFRYDKISGFELGRRRPTLEVALVLQQKVGIPADSWLEPADPRAVEDGRVVSVA